MWKNQESTNLIRCLFLMFVLSSHLLETARALSDKRLCADEHCKEIISFGVGAINYTPGEEGMISFNMNSVIRIKSKGAGSQPNIWGIEVNGREGYAPKHLIRETRVLISEKDLKFLVDVKQKPKDPVLTTSEKLVGQGNAPEVVTTKPLNLTPAESASNTLNNYSNEKISAENLPTATPVLPEVVDGTLVTNNDNANELSLEEKVQRSSKNAALNEQDYNTTLEPEVKSNQVEYPKGEVISETANQQLIIDELNINNTKNESENYVIKDDKNDAKFKEPHIENAFNNELNTNLELEAGKTQDKPIYETPKVATESAVVDYTSDNEYTSNSSDIIAEDKKADMLDQAKYNTIHTITEVASEDPNQNISTEPSAGPEQSSHNGGDANDQYTKIPQNLLDHSQNLESPTNEDNKPKNEVEENTKRDSTQEVNASGEEQSVNNVFSSNNEPNTTQVEIKSANEVNEPKNVVAEEVKQFNGTLNEESTHQLNIQTLANSTDVSIAETEGSTSNNNINSTKPDAPKPATDLIKDSGETTGDEDLKTEEFKHKNEEKIEEFKIETNLNMESNETNIREIDKHKVTSTEDRENKETDGSANKSKHIDESSFSVTDNSNPDSLHNQQEIHHEIQEKDSLQQQNEDPVGNSETSHIESLEKEVKDEQVSSNFALNTEQVDLNVTYQTSAEINNHNEVVENINPTTYNPTADIALNTPLPMYEEDVTTNTPSTDNHGQHLETSQQHFDSIDTKNMERPPTATPTATAYLAEQLNERNDENNEVPQPADILEPKENKGLFATIMGTVNNMWTNNRRKQNEFDDSNDLDRILFSHGNSHKNNMEQLNEERNFPYCKNVEPNGDCPESSESHDHTATNFHHTAEKFPLGSDLTMETFLTSMASKILEMSELIAFLAIAAAASLFFVFGYYCFCNSSREGALLLKLNQLESSFLASHKENAILKHNLMATRQKLASIEDNSFGSNDMVASLKKELEEELLEKARLQEQITALQKELENAADAGIELNKIVAELLSNQTGDESIISSVEELQKQLNEQQNTIYEINASLAEKSRENSELQLMIAEQNARYEAELANLQRDNDELEHEKGNLLTRLEEMKTDFDRDITVALEGKNMEIKRMQNDILELSSSLENEHTKWQTSVAKIEALEECLKNVRKDPKVNISEVIDVANVKAQLIEAQKMYKSLKERFETELDGRKLSENQLQVVTAEVEKLKQDFNQSEKDKLEAQTRLEVLSNYFKDKENQLQKELSLKEAMWLQQQGETTTTVDRVTAMQEEIQSLKSQNDSLRAEIEAQLAAHKAQTGTLENRAHETWLAARQSDRRYEEARAEATALRRKLTALAGGNVAETNKSTAGPPTLGDDLAQAPSPIHMESPGSPMLGRMPPPPFLPPPFMGPHPPFIGMPPPPPFVPPGEMRPAPLGRIMSPPPQRSGRFSPQHLDYEDYLDYEGNNNTWHRYTYSPPPRTYRSLSPTDSRYNYGTERDLMSTYDTETDFSPPPSPRESRRRIGNSSERIDSSTKIAYVNTKKFNSSNKGPLSSGSEKSFNTPSHHDTKTKKGSSSAGGGKNLI